MAMTRSDFYPGRKLLVTKDRVNRSNIGTHVVVTELDRKWFKYEGIENPNNSGVFIFYASLYEDGYIYELDPEENTHLGFKLL